MAADLNRKDERRSWQVSLDLHRQFELATAQDEARKSQDEVTKLKLLLRQLAGHESTSDAIAGLAKLLGTT